jgi:hypothetical protein
MSGEVVVVQKYPRSEWLAVELKGVIRSGIPQI